MTPGIASKTIGPLIRVCFGIQGVDERYCEARGYSGRHALGPGRLRRWPPDRMSDQVSAARAGATVFPATTPSAAVRDARTIDFDEAHPVKAIIGSKRIKPSNSSASIADWAVGLRRGLPPGGVALTTIGNTLIKQDDLPRRPGAPGRLEAKGELGRRDG